MALSQAAANQDANSSEGDAKAAERSFLEKVGRTVFINNLSPAVTPAILLTALSQFGDVKSTTILEHDLDPSRSAGAALVEMGSVQTANNVVSELQSKLFMLGGIPRPVWASLATPDKFPNRPVLRRRRMKARFVDRKCPEGLLAEKRRRLAWKHLQEVQALEKEFQEEDRELAEIQEAQFHAEYQKLDLVKQLGNGRGPNNLRRIYVDMGLLQPQPQT